MTYIIITDYFSFLRSIHNNSLLFIKPSILILFSRQVCSFIMKRLFLMEYAKSNPSLDQNSLVTLAVSDSRCWRQVIYTLTPLSVADDARPLQDRHKRHTTAACLVYCTYLWPTSFHTVTLSEQGRKIRRCIN
jgi:hypothetical protein